MAAIPVQPASKPPRITLYTDHICPYAHRVHITLKELGLAHEEVFVDISTPRPSWYLDVNPRGLVPAIKFSSDIFSDEILIESQIITNFLNDVKPSHLLPLPSASSDAPLQRAQMNFFIDTFCNKINPYQVKVLLATTDKEKTELCDELEKNVQQHIEPLLKDAAPFFGGSKELTNAEVQTAPFLIRIYENVKMGLLPVRMTEIFAKYPNFDRWAQAVIHHDSVTPYMDPETLIRMKERISSMRANRKEASGANFAHAITSKLQSSPWSLIVPALSVGVGFALIKLRAGRLV